MARLLLLLKAVKNGAVKTMLNQNPGELQRLLAELLLSLTASRGCRSHPQQVGNFVTAAALIGPIDTQSLVSDQHRTDTASSVSQEPNDGVRGFGSIKQTKPFRHVKAAVWPFKLVPGSWFHWFLLNSGSMCAS